jgi:hypothetical protein
MKIYKLQKEYSFAELIPNTESLDMINEGFIGKPMKDDWNIQKMQWNLEESDVIGDFSFLAGLIPVINNNVLEKLDKLITEEYVELLPIVINNEKYFALNLLNINSDILNIKKSNLEYFEDNSIMYINEYVFNDIGVEPIFKISQLTTHIFVTDIFKNIIEKEKVTGINFIDCKVKSKRWF